VFLLQPIFVVCINLEDGELVFAQSIDLAVLTQLDLLYISRNLVISYFLAIEVE